MCPLPEALVEGFARSTFTRPFAGVGCLPFTDLFAGEGELRFFGVFAGLGDLALLDGLDDRPPVEDRLATAGDLDLRGGMAKLRLLSP